MATPPNLAPATIPGDLTPDQQSAMLQTIADLYSAQNPELRDAMLEGDYSTLIPLSQVGGPKAQAAERERRIREGMNRINSVMSQFDDSFYGQLRQAQLDSMLPNIRDQYSDARDQLTYTLARGGQLNSSVAAQRQAKLAKERELMLSRADSIAEQAVKQQRQDIEREREGLVMQLQATADPTNVSNQANLRAEALRIGQPQADIGIMFQNATAGLAAALRPTYDAYGVRVNGPSFGSQRTSSRVISGG